MITADVGDGDDYGGGGGDDEGRPRVLLMELTSKIEMAVGNIISYIVP